jgi:glycosyltransferase involved in cell wall biosynthesis
MTVVHHPLDTRILVRQIAALVDAGHVVTYAAPFSAHGVDPPVDVATIDLPRSVGRRRLGALRAARRLLRQTASDYDVVLIHDAELILAAASVRDTPVVWDVHEDTAAAVTYKEWIPPALDRVAAGGIRALERWAERRCELLLAEAAYSERFRRPHPVVPNSTIIEGNPPSPGPGRAVCVSTLTKARGALDLIEVGRMLRSHGIVLDIVGTASADVEEQLRRADLDGDVRWHGRLPHPQAVERMRGATAGLSLLHNENNYRNSHPTKVFEYLAMGIPVVATPLPLVVDVLNRHDAGIIVPFRDPAAAATAVIELHQDEERRRRLGDNGRAAVLAHHNWADDATPFVTAVVAASRTRSRGLASTQPPPLQ